MSKRIYLYRPPLLQLSVFLWSVPYILYNFIYFMLIRCILTIVHTIYIHTKDDVYKFYLKYATHLNETSLHITTYVAEFVKCLSCNSTTNKFSIKWYIVLKSELICILLQVVWHWMFNYWGPSSWNSSGSFYPSNTSAFTVCSAGEFSGFLQVLD